MQTAKPHKIALYIRVSSEEQAASPEGSIKNQEHRLRALVKFKNMEGHFGEIKTVYVDRAKSGKDTNRPELQKLLLSIRKREIDLVMVTELSRISRSIKDFSDIWDLMKANNCGFYSNRENFDTTTAAGEMVLFTVANIAQFERRQISERVAANFNARAQRGLFNGGSIPFGYKRIEGKTGYLEIDEDARPVVHAAFKAFLREGSLMPAAKWLNEQGFRWKKEREGGGLRTRLGFFTVTNLKMMLKNKFYIGVKVYRNKTEKKETEAVWPAIVDPELFAQVNDLLSKNFRRKKDAMQDRYPYQLVGLISCKACGDRMVGKSAHGNGGKIGYYEHAWSTMKGSYVPGLKHQCQPYRVLAKQLEPAVWNEVSKLFEKESFAAEILKAAKRSHDLNPESREVEKCNQTVFSVDRQLELMAERLSSLPETISPTPIYKQMEKLEGHKKEAQARLASLQATGATRDEPVEMRDFTRFLAAVKGFLRSDDSVKMRMKIIRLLVRKVLITTEGCEIYFKVGQTFVQIFLKDVDGENGKKTIGLGESGHKKRAKDFLPSPELELSQRPEKDFKKNLEVFGSNTCIFGRRDWI